MCVVKVILVCNGNCEEEEMNECSGRCFQEFVGVYIGTPLPVVVNYKPLSPKRCVDYGRYSTYRYGNLQFVWFFSNEK